MEDYKPKNPVNDFLAAMLSQLQAWNDQKKAEGFIPTVDMLIEELRERLEVK